MKKTGFTERYRSVSYTHLDVYKRQLETMREDYVRTARAKGLSESLVVMRHAFKNSLIEIVTVAGLQIGGLLSGSVMAETVFSIPCLLYTSRCV